MTLPAVGQDAPPEAVQLTCVQFMPVTEGSLSTVPSPSDGPPLVTVSEYVVVLPATSELTPLLLAIARLADRVLVKVQLESPLAGGVITALRVLPTRVVDVGVMTALVSSLIQLTAETYFVMLLLDPEVSVSVTDPDKLCW